MDRREPAGHAAPVTGLLHGVLEFVLEARSRLLVRWPASDRAERDLAAAVPRQAGGAGTEAPVLPGSSVHGALRSLHEVVAGGCLRVFDGDFVPSYRDQMWTDEHVFSQWRLAVVEEVDGDGRPGRVRLSDVLPYALPSKGRETRRSGGFWVDVDALGLTGLRTGDRLNLELPKASSVAYRPQFNEVESVAQDPAGAWVVLFTDAGARAGKKHYFVTVGRLGTLTAGVSDGAWREYLDAAAGSDDLRRANQDRKQPNGSPARGGREKLSFADSAGPVPVEVLFGADKRSVGFRHAVLPFLHPGQVVWVQVQGRTDAERMVTVMKPAWFWRHSGTGAASRRVPPSLLPCELPDRLCPSCRLFGSADTSGRRVGEQAWQASYRGHVRVLDAEAVGAVPVELVDLAPMGAPRVGAGQFYLTTGGRSVVVEGRGPADRPAREWGSASDDPDQLRLLRGRKMYWRTREVPGRERFRKRSHHDHAMAARVEVFGAGARFKVRLVFENVTQAQLGALVAVVDPGRLFARTAGGDGRCVAEATRPPGWRPGKGEEPEFVVAVGGGKPFGFGSCVARDVVVRLIDPGVRYRGPGGGAGAVLAGADLDAVVDAFVTDRLRVTPWLGRQWEHASRALRVDQVAPAVVWYPPGGQWDSLDAAAAADSKRRRELEETFDKPFAFFGQTIGYRRSGGDAAAQPLTELPRIDAADQRLEIIPDSGKKS